MHITETIAVLFIFFVLVAFGLIFYSKYQEYSLKEEQEKIIISRAIRTTSKVLFLPELQCSKGEAEPEDNCIDLMKMRQVENVFKKHKIDYYYNIFGYSRITVNQLYPLFGKWTIYDQPKPTNSSTESSGYEATFFTITLKDESVGGEKIRYGYGYIEVGVYS